MSLRKFRASAKLSQPELARLSGVKQQTISLIERTDNPNVELKTARALVGALAEKVPCTLDEVFPEAASA